MESGKIKTDINPLIKLSANYIITEFPKFVSETGEINITAENFAELIYMTFIGDISSSGAQEVLKEMFKIGADPSQIIESKNLKQLSDTGELSEIIDKIIKNNPQPVEDYKKGKDIGKEAEIIELTAIDLEFEWWYNNTCPCKK